jgi:ABC-2 type transport system ATP-binding protein
MADMRMLECRGLRRSSSDRAAADGVGFRIGAGERYGLLGPDGAGKTTRISMIAGLLERDGGEVVAGEPMTTRAMRRR